MASITVTHRGGQAFEVRTRQHSWLVDQPSNGAELGPTPVEQFVGSFAACAAHYATAYLRDDGLPYAGLRVGSGCGSIRRSS